MKSGTAGSIVAKSSSGENSIHPCARLAKLANAKDLGSFAARLAGSSPAPRTSSTPENRPFLPRFIRLLSAFACYQMRILFFLKQRFLMSREKKVAPMKLAAGSIRRRGSHGCFAYRCQVNGRRTEISLHGGAPAVYRTQHHDKLPQEPAKSTSVFRKVHRYPTFLFIVYCLTPSRTMVALYVNGVQKQCRKRRWLRPRWARSSASYSLNLRQAFPADGG